MQNHHDEDYELGEDVTALAAPRSKQATAVLSVRLSVEDLAMLEQLGTSTGKTISQIAREAISAVVRAPSQQNSPLTVIASMEGFTASTPTLGASIRTIGKVGVVHGSAHLRIGD